MDKNGLSETLRAQAEQMYKKYRPLVRSDVLNRMRCSGEQAEDITEEVFERACRSLKNGSGPTISEKKWLMKIAEHVCLGHLKKGKMQNNLSLECPILINGEEKFLADQIVDTGQSPEEIIEQRELLATLSKAIEKLSPQIQQAVILYYLSGLTSKDISKKLNRAPSTVERYKREGIQQLQEGLIQE